MLIKLILLLIHAAKVERKNASDKIVDIELKNKRHDKSAKQFEFDELLNVWRFLLNYSIKFLDFKKILLLLKDMYGKHSPPLTT